MFRWGKSSPTRRATRLTAIPKLLEIIELSGSLVTIDALGCQVEIAQKIVDGGADYCLAVKKNQPTLHEAIEAYFGEHLEHEFEDVKVRRHQTTERGHGRQEQRFYYLCPAPEDLSGRERWPQLAAIGMSINITQRDGQEQSAVRYYILSEYLSAGRFAEAVRGHWSIENSLHWQLDVTFGEDQSRIRKGHADANFSLLRRTSLSLLKNNQTAKLGVKNKRLKAAWDDDYRLQVLLGK